MRRRILHIILLVLFATTSIADVMSATLYMRNDVGWSNVKVHYWGGSSTSWPGLDMTDRSGDLGAGWWSITIPDNLTGIIFNNGSGQQTGDIKGFTQGADLAYIVNSDKSYTSTDIPGGTPTLTVTANKSNPITKGSSVTLTANNATSACTWYQSTDGTNWTACSATPSGTNNSVVTVSPTVDTYYKVSTTGGDAQYKVQVESNEMAYAITGGVNGTDAWKTVVTAANLFTYDDGCTCYYLDITYANSEFKVLGKNGGTVGQDWGWSSEINITAGTNISGGNGANLSVKNFNVGDAVRLVLVVNGSTYTLSAQSLTPTLNITANKSNPITKGSSVTLTANNATSACTWYQSTDGTNWTACSATPSGTNNSVVTVSPTVDTYYKVSTAEGDAQYKVQVESNEMAFAITGGINGTTSWKTTVSAENLFTYDEANDNWYMTFTVSGTDGFKVIGKKGGTIGQDWGWESVVCVNNGDNITRNGDCKGDLKLDYSVISEGDEIKLVLTKDGENYRLDAEFASSIKIIATRPNPITQGEDIQLYARDAASACTWEFSYDGVVWTPYSGASSGVNNDTISPLPLVNTYYRVTCTEGTAQYLVQAYIKCKGESQTHLNEDFGTLSSERAHKTDSNVDAAYGFCPEGKELHDGWYAVVADPYFCGNGNRQTPNDCNPGSCTPADTNTVNHGDNWYVHRTDHTGNTNGGMLFINCKNKGEVMYSYTKSGLCKNMYMTFSAWFASASKSDAQPNNTRFIVLDENGDEIVSARFDLSGIKSSAGWVHGVTSFYSGDNDKLTVQIINNGASGQGNDILVDDITFTSCIPQMSIRPAMYVDCGDMSRISVESEGIDVVFGGVKPFYLWQEWNYETSSWSDIPNDPVNGSGYGNTQYEFRIYHQEAAMKPKFRVVMSLSESEAKQVGHDIFPVCLNYAMTDELVVDCECPELDPIVIQY